MPKSHHAYAPEFRRQIVELVRAGRTPAELSREFECSANSIRIWVRQVDLDEGRRDDGLTTDEREEVRRLRGEVRQLREERETVERSRSEGAASSSRARGSIYIEQINVLQKAVNAPGRMPDNDGFFLVGRLQKFKHCLADTTQTFFKVITLIALVGCNGAAHCGQKDEILDLSDGEHFNTARAQILNFIRRPMVTVDNTVARDAC